MAQRNEALRRRFGRALRAARDEAALTQEELADRSGLHHTYISQLERGLKSPSVEALFAIARGLGMPAHVLVEAAEHGR